MPDPIVVILVSSKWCRIYYIAILKIKLGAFIEKLLFRTVSSRIFWTIK